MPRAGDRLEALAAKIRESLDEHRLVAPAFLTPDGAAAELLLAQNV